MLNQFAKLLLVATSLSPILGAVAVSQFAAGRPWTSWCVWLIVGILLAVICWVLLTHTARSAQTQLIKVQEFENNDKEVLAFLLTYLLPFISTEDVAFGEKWAIGVYVFVIIFIVVSHAGAFHFNPVMGMLGYHFHNIKNGDGRPILLIGKTHLRRCGHEVKAVELADNIYLQVP